MEKKHVVASITIYPVKSLDGMPLQKGQIGKGGSLVHDREFAIRDANGKYVNGKSNAMVHLLRSKVDFENEIIYLRPESATAWNEFHLQKDKTSIDDYLSDFFKMDLTLHRNTEGKFLDVPIISGVTVLSTASLQAASSWFNEMQLAEIRKRMRATIEIADVPAFWEDKLFYKEKEVVEFRIGDVTLYGMSPRARCVVPTRHPQTRELIHGFQKSFAGQRLANLPDWSNLNDYGHGYYLSVDCYIPPSEFGKWIGVGDEINILNRRIIS